MAERDGAGQGSYGDWRSLELAIKDAAKKAARQAGPRSRATKDADLAALRASDLAEAGRALATLVEADLGDHLTFGLIRSTPTGLGENQPGVATRRYFFACVPAAESLSAQAAAGLVSSFVDPALGRGSDPATCDPYALAWMAPTAR